MVKSPYQALLVIMMKPNNENLMSRFQITNNLQQYNQFQATIQMIIAVTMQPLFLWYGH